MTQNQRDMRLVSVSVSDAEWILKSLVETGFPTTGYVRRLQVALNLALQAQPPAQGEAQALLTQLLGMCNSLFALIKPEQQQELRPYLGKLSEDVVRLATPQAQGEM